MGEVAKATMGSALNQSMRLVLGGVCLAWMMVASGMAGAQHAEWKQSRDLAISDGEIDLDAGNNPDEWSVRNPG